MEPVKRIITKEAFQDGNFSDAMFKGAAVADDQIIDQSDLSKGNHRSYLLFKHTLMLQFRKQYKNTKRSLDEFAISAVEGFDVFVGNSLNPAESIAAPNQNGNDTNGKNVEMANNSDPQDPDKIFRTYPSFDPVFMKV